LAQEVCFEQDVDSPSGSQGQANVRACLGRESIGSRLDKSQRAVVPMEIAFLVPKDTSMV